MSFSSVERSSVEFVIISKTGMWELKTRKYLLVTDYTQRAVNNLVILYNESAACTYSGEDTNYNAETCLDKIGNLAKKHTGLKLQLHDSDFLWRKHYKCK